MNTILHVCSRDIILELRDQVIRLHGFDVVSTLSLEEAVELYRQQPCALVLIDVEGDGRIPQAEKLCETVKKHNPQQKVAFVCNYRVSRESDCPDEVIRSDFNPEKLVKGIKEMIEKVEPS